MKKFRVTVARDRHESCVVEVDSDDPEQAAQDAFRVALAPSFRGWQLEPPHTHLYAEKIEEIGSVHP